METTRTEGSVVRRRRNAPQSNRTEWHPSTHLRRIIARTHSLRRYLNASRVGRRAARWRLMALTSALLVAVSTHHFLRSAEAVRESWGSTAYVVVSLKAIGADEPLDSTTVEVRALPLVALPEAPVRVLESGQRAARPIESGRILVESDLRQRDSGPTATQLAPGRAGVVVPTVPGAVAVAVGDRVDVVRSASTGDTAIVAADAEVLSVAPEAVTLSVAASTAANVAGLALAEPLGLTVRPPPP